MADHLRFEIQFEDWRLGGVGREGAVPEWCLQACWMRRSPATGRGSGWRGRGGERPSLQRGPEPCRQVASGAPRKSEDRREADSLQNKVFLFICILNGTKEKELRGVIIL